MYDGPKVIFGLIVLAAGVAFPFLYNKGKPAKMPQPNFDTPAIKALPKGQRTCVEPTPFMRENHMKLLYHWRDQAVRKGNRQYTGANGKKYVVSLQNTCLRCHSNYDKFCKECHSFVGVEPNCWGCHVPRPQQWARGGK